MQNAYKQYQNNSVLTANREELTMMLYNGAIKFANQAVEAIERKDIQRAHTCNIKAQRIISELQITLDKNYAYASDINALYDFINQLLREGNIEKNIEKIEQAIELIRDFKEMWKQVVSKAKKGY